MAEHHGGERGRGLGEEDAGVGEPGEGDGQGAEVVEVAVGDEDGLDLLPGDEVEAGKAAPSLAPGVDAGVEEDGGAVELDEVGGIADLTGGAEGGEGEAHSDLAAGGVPCRARPGEGEGHGVFAASTRSTSAGHAPSTGTPYSFTPPVASGPVTWA